MSTPAADDRSLDKRKRKAAYRRQAASSAKLLRSGGRGGQPDRLAPGRRGLLITCNKRERECVGEAYDILDEFLPAPAAGDAVGGSDDDADDDDDDIQSRIKRERLAAAGGPAGHQPESSGQPAYEQLRTQVANCVFIGVSRPAADRLPWLFSVTDAVFEAAVAAAAAASSGGPRRRGVGGRHILRLLPVEATCASGLEEIVGAFATVWDAFAAAGFVQADAPTFTVHFKARNFDKLDRQDVIGRIYSAVKAATPAWSVNHDLADVVIDVNVLQKVTCLSLLRRFRGYRKYNLAEVVLNSAAADCAPLQSAVTETETARTETVKTEAVAAETSKAEADGAEAAEATGAGGALKLTDDNS